MVEEIKVPTTDNQANSDSQVLADVTAQTESNRNQQTAAPQQDSASQPEKPKAGELLCFGGAKKSGGLQANFARFRKAKADEVKYRNYMAKQTQVDRRDPEFKRQLRQKFVEGCKKYFGVPYAKRYHKEGEPLYDSPIFLDCCALVR